MTAPTGPVGISPDSALPLLKVSDLVVLIGISENELSAALPFSRVPWVPPVEWMRSARRRFREAQAAVGSSDLSLCIAYLGSGNA